MVSQSEITVNQSGSVKVSIPVRGSGKSKQQITVEECKGGKVVSIPVRGSGKSKFMSPVHAKDGGKFQSP